ncbi:hypothetical protein J19TS2_48010 [Cohnella xylanilytica]|uniref:hypothetical protein n=1 Tax=Cohnella xylanilytica TaxID=557555 RepID=UPI001B289ED0|nr:hypothetical protein [Cohnella xylanilytica]GIO15246.1 hypothetical protein J19TS2_48010 [Cohnella xylanilytica]
MRNRAFVVLIIVAFLLFIGFLAYYFNDSKQVSPPSSDSVLKGTVHKIEKT